jgi:hypothetical protein
VPLLGSSIPERRLWSHPATEIADMGIPVLGGSSDEQPAIAGYSRNFVTGETGTQSASNGF